MALTLMVSGFAAFGVANPADASPSGSTHSIPGGNMHSGGVDTLCYDATGFSCAGAGYNGTSGQIGGNGWTTSQYWSYGSAGPNGTRHNCTTYAAYRLQQNGYGYPGWTDNANGWDTQAYAHGTVVDQTPAVGAIAQWNGGTAGHVAYVEVVTDSYIETTSDSYGGGTDHQRIDRSSGYMPDNFVHFKDQATPPPPPPAYQPNLLTNSSFDQGGMQGWGPGNGTINYTAYLSGHAGVAAKEGAYYGAWNTATGGHSLAQNINVAPAAGSSYTFSVWLRSSTSTKFHGTLTLWGLGGSQEAGNTSFTVGPSWKLVTTSLNASNSGHTALKAEIYAATTNQDLYVDASSLAAYG